MLQKLRTKGLVKGLYLGLVRLMKCHPFSKVSSFVLVSGLVLFGSFATGFAKDAAAKNNKIDIHSLGLDDLDGEDVDENNNSAADIKNSSNSKISNSLQPSLNKSKASTPKTIDSNSRVSKVQDFLKSANQSENKGEEMKSDSKKTVDKVDKAVPNTENEKITTKKVATIGKAEKQDNDKSSNKKEESKKRDVEIINDDSMVRMIDGKVVPRKKELSNFTTTETPPMPLLERIKPQENRHLPAILFFEEKVRMLFESIDEGNVALFNELYKQVNGLDVESPEGRTILTYAVSKSQYPIIISTLSKGVNPNMTDLKGLSPMIIAIEKGDLRAVELLTGAGALLNYRDSLGENYLMKAVKVGNLPIIAFLSSKGIDLGEFNNEGLDVFAIAKRYNQQHVLSFLIATDNN